MTMDTRQFKFKPFAAMRTERIPPEKWQEHKEELSNLYLEKTLGELMIVMRDRHSFVPSYVVSVLP
jgi:hypothetical protein